MWLCRYFYLGEKTIVKFVFSIVKYFCIGLFTLINVIPTYFIIGIVSIFTKKVPKRESVDKVLIVLALGVYLFTVFITGRWIMQNIKVKDITDDIINNTPVIDTPSNITEPFDNITIDNDDTNENNGNNGNNGNNTVNNDYYNYQKLSYISVNFDDLIKTNEDTVAWIRVEGTEVNYPVVQQDNNNYYLRHTFRKNENKAGWIFADYRDDFDNFGKNTIIYGHNMRSKVMFGTLPNILTDNWYNNKDNHFVKISTPKKNTIWQVFSVYMTEPETYYISSVFNDRTYKKFIDTLVSRSKYTFNTNVDLNDKILTLSTCNNAGTKRIVMHAKLISETER